MVEWAEYGNCMICGTEATLEENAYGWHTCCRCGDSTPSMNNEKTRRVGPIEYFFWWLNWKFSDPEHGVVPPEWRWFPE